MFLQSVSAHPRLGKEQEVRVHLEAWAKTGLSQGRKIGLTVAKFSAEGTVFVRSVRIKDLAEIEQTRQPEAIDPTFQDVVAMTASLTHRPAKFELLEVHVPLPS